MFNGSIDFGEKQPPPFGHQMRTLFGFAPDYINLNHGSYGSLPLPVLEACEKLGRVVESNPDRFIRVEFTPALDSVREGVAKLIGADTDECVLVPNTTHGINNVLANFDWKTGDVIIEATTSYSAIRRIIRYLADESPHPTISEFILKFPCSHAEILNDWKSHLRNIHRYPGQKVVAVIDGIVSNPGVRLPWEEMVKICKQEAVYSVIDAAHCIGQQVDLDMHNSDPDFWVSNCHKWLFSKRVCATLYVPKRNQHLIKTSFPTDIGYVSPNDPPGKVSAPNFVGQYAWTGTLDPVAYLSIAYALEFRKWIGGEKAINDYCHELAIAGGKRMAELLGTRYMDTDDFELTVNMANVEIPLTGVGNSRDVLLHIRRELGFEWNTQGAVFYHGDAWWIRCSAQIWNDISDFEYIAKALKSICDKIEKNGILSGHSAAN